MPFALPRADDTWIALLLLGALLTISAGVALADTNNRIVVSQRGRAFSPGAITVETGDTLKVVNDDGDVVHHVYIDDPEFSFDSDDQMPGDHTDITFTKPGIFDMLCGIHPRMKLTVTVQDKILLK